MNNANMSQAAGLKRLVQGLNISLIISLTSACMPANEQWVRHEVQSESNITDTTLVLQTDQTLSTANLLQLDQFRSRWLPRPGDRLELTAAADAEATAREAAQWLAMRGMAPSVKRDPVLPAGHLHLAVVHFQTRLPECGNWDKAREVNFSNTPAIDFGCSNARNLGLMVADPADLASPAGPGASSGEEAAAAIGRYRDFHETASSDSSATVVSGDTSGGTTE